MMLTYKFCFHTRFLLNNPILLEVEINTYRFHKIEKVATDMFLFTSLAMPPDTLLWSLLCTTSALGLIRLTVISLCLLTCCQSSLLAALSKPCLERFGKMPCPTFHPCSLGSVDPRWDCGSPDFKRPTKWIMYCQGWETNIEWLT